MAFWRIGNGFATTSAINKLLDKSDVTLIEVLEEPDLLPELMAPNTKLVEYLREPEILRELVNLITDTSLSTSAEPPVDSSSSPTEEPENDSNNESNDKTTDIDIDSSQKEPPTYEANENEDENILNTTTPTITHDNEENDQDDAEEPSDSKEIKEEEEEDGEENTGSYFDETESRQHFANIASEILSGDVWSITEALMETSTLIEDIWMILDYPTPLSMAHASYFTKINEHLLDKKTEELLSFIKVQDNFVERFMKHIDNPPLMDFLLKVISSDKPDNSTGVIEFLQHQKLIPALISFLGPDVSSSVQSAAGDFLKAFVTISANSNSDNTTIGPNELSRELVSEPCVRELVRLMLFGGSGLATGVGVVIEIIRKNNSDYDFVPVMYITIESHPPTTRDPIYLGTLVKVFAENLPKFNDMLVRKHSEVLKTPFGQIEPLGFERFKICELVAELLHCSNMALLNDPNGESNVRARDVERIRVLKSLAESSGGYPPLDNVKENDAPSSEPASIPEEDEKEEALADDLSSLSLKKSESSEEGDSPTLPSEESLRANPVVGDLLKITLADNQIITHILQMFFQFPWNNFLHNVVFDIVQQVLNGPIAEGFNRYLAIDLFKSGRLTYLICEGQKKCAEYQEKHNCRLGYMGHLTLVSEEVVKFTFLYKPETVSPIIEKVVQEPDWVHYVSETLARTREQYNSILGGQRSEDSQDDLEPGKEVSVAADEENTGEYEDDMKDEDPRDEKEEEGSDKFSRYVSQQMTNGGQFGSSDEDEDEEEEDVWEEKRSEKESEKHDSDSKVQLLGSVDDDEEEEDEEDGGLDLVRSKSIH